MGRSAHLVHSIKCWPYQKYQVSRERENASTSETKAGNFFLDDLWRDSLTDTVRSHQVKKIYCAENTVMIMAENVAAIEEINNSGDNKKKEGGMTWWMICRAWP